ncbi:MAG: hypothetical protein U0R24_08345 [Solirubrobacterales bacterium]
MNRVLGVLAAAVALVALGASPAVAATGDLTFAGCVANDSTQGCTDIPNSPLGGAEVVVSPDGRSVYASGVDALNNGIISEFSRAADGSLAYLGCIGDNSSQGCTDVPGAPLRGLSQITLSPDGRSLYAASSIADSLAHFTRGDDGRLTFDQCLASNAVDGCTDVAGLNTPMTNASLVAVSPDGGSVYVRAGPPSGGDLVRFSADAGGDPSYVGCIADVAGNSCTASGGGRLNGGGGLVATADSIYTAGSDTDTIDRFDRSTFGFGQCISGAAFPGCSTLPASPGLMRAAAVSPDGSSLYIVGTDISLGVITQLSIGPGGALSYVGCQADSQAGCLDLPNSPLGRPFDVAVSPDGDSVYTAGADLDGVATFRRAGDGSLAYASCLANSVTQGCGAVPGGPLDGADAVTVSPDGRNVYLLSSGSKSLAVFSRETPSAPLTLDLAAKSKQKVGKLAVKATCSVACDIEVRAKGKAGKKFKSKLADGALQAGVATKLKLKLKGKVLRKVDDRKGKVTFVATATTPAGASAEDSAKAKLKP